jgi:23S rRNA-/tRNA-specific pseudouridylate synthase
VDAPIRRREGSIIAREVGDGGKPSVTHWEALGCDGRYTLLRVVIDTGRTHQIRVHMAHLGHPLAGDTLYGDPDAAAHPIGRQALHCAEIDVPHPDTGEILRFESPLPPDMAALIRERSLSRYGNF